MQKTSVWGVVLVFLLWGCDLPASRNDNRDRITWQSTRAIVRQDFPQVRQLSIQQYRQGVLSKPLLVDARDSEEYAVSHIAGAVNLQNPEEIIRLARQQGRSSILLYCSVGYRSSRLADRIAQQGFSEVYNLEGSLFQWANLGLPLVNQAGTARFVHPYNDEWGVLLNPQYHPQ